MIHLEDNELFKEGVTEMLEKEEETEKLIIAHKDDNIILNFIYNIYAGKYKVLNKLLDKTLVIFLITMMMILVYIHLKLNIAKALGEKIRKKIGLFQ